MNAPDQYLPRADSLPWRVCAYFRRLPDEELSNKDIGVKWHADPKNVPVQLSSAVVAGLLVRDGTVYSPGPNIDRMDLAVDIADPLTIPRPMGKQRNKPVEVDIEAIEFETLSPTLAKPVQERWLAKLTTMKPGQSFAVDMTHAHALRGAATTLRKGGRPFRVLMNQEGDGGATQVRVFCLEGA